MWRIVFTLCCFGGPGAAWEASGDGVICRLNHDQAEVSVELTYDPSGPAYTIALTRKSASWPVGAVFSIAFSGAAPLTISTTRHRITGQTLHVADTGFGNVLNGLALNDRATAMLGAAQVPFALAGARPEVEKFIACTRGPKPLA